MSVTTRSRDQRDSILTGRQGHDRGLRSRPRRRGLLAFAALLIVGSAIAVAVLVSQAGETHEVLAARGPISQGHRIARSDLVVKDVAGVGETFAPAQASSLIGSTAVVGAVPGQVLTRAMVTKSPSPGTGESMVGLDLDPSRLPSSGLGPGDYVTVVAVPGDNTGGSADQLDAPPVLASHARVYDVSGSATEGGGELVTLVVPQLSAARIAAYSTAKRVAIIETAAGDSSGGP